MGSVILVDHCVRSNSLSKSRDAIFTFVFAFFFLLISLSRRLFVNCFVSLSRAMFIYNSRLSSHTEIKVIKKFKRQQNDDRLVIHDRCVTSLSTIFIFFLEPWIGGTPAGLPLLLILFEAETRGAETASKLNDKKSVITLLIKRKYVVALKFLTAQLVWIFCLFG